MREWKRVKISQFLKEREGRYDPGDEAVQGLKRLNKIDFSGEIHLSDKGSKTDMIIVEPGDIVISGINVSKGALAVYHGEEPITATIHYSSYAFDERQIDIDYFKRFVRSQSFIQALKDQVKGGIKTEIKPKYFLPLEIHLPDIESQKEVVSFFKRIENEMGDLSGEITHQQSFLKQLRQQILQEAIEGKLTSEWRDKHPELISGDNHASKLLEKIKAEKERLIKEGKIKKDKPLAPITDDEKPFDLPDGWVWCRLGNVAVHSLGKMLDKAKNRGIYRKYLRNLNVRWFTFDLSDLLEMRFREEEVEQYTARKGDLLICEGGYPGRAAIWDQECDIYFQKAVHRVRFIVRDMNKYFLYFLFLSDMNRYLERYFTGASIQHFTGKELHNFVFPLPPLAEQQGIVERVDKLMAMTDELEKQVSERKEQSEMLMQSVLREAFAKE